MDTVGIEKSKIENAQRELRKKELAEGQEWQRRFFKRLPGGCPIFDQLARAVGERIESDKTGGVWRFSGDRLAASDSASPMEASKRAAAS